MNKENIEDEILICESNIHSLKDEISTINKLKKDLPLPKEIDFFSFLNNKEKDLSLNLEFWNNKLNKNKKIYSLISFS